MKTVVLVSVLEKLKYTWPLELCGIAAAAVEVATHGAGHAVLVCFAYIYEEVAVLSAAVKPFL